MKVKTNNTPRSEHLTKRILKTNKRMDHLLRKCNDGFSLIRYWWSIYNSLAFNLCWLVHHLIEMPLPYFESLSRTASNRVLNTISVTKLITICVQDQRVLFILSGKLIFALYVFICLLFVVVLAMFFALYIGIDTKYQTQDMER